jgi:hypothetical protein
MNLAPDIAAAAVRPATHVPSVLTAPSVPDASAAAATSLRVTSQLLADGDAAAVANALGMAKYGRTLLVNDNEPNNDAFVGIIDDTIVAPIEESGAATFATQTPDASALLTTARIAAEQVAQGLQPQR